MLSNLWQLTTLINLSYLVRDGTKKVKKANGILERMFTNFSHSLSLRFNDFPLRFGKNKPHCSFAQVPG